jgi:hypothetical protein
MKSQGKIMCSVNSFTAIDCTCLSLSEHELSSVPFCIYSFHVVSIGIGVTLGGTTSVGSGTQPLVSPLFTFDLVRALQSALTALLEPVLL